MALTDKQERFIREAKKSENATIAFVNAFGSLRGFKQLDLCDDPVGMVVFCIDVLDDESKSARQKKACLALLKIFVTNELRNLILSDCDLYPVDRRDSRAGKWTRKILSIGRCELCGGEDNLCAHHVLKWSEYPRGRIDINNGQCLCVHCHADIHEGEKGYYLLKSNSQKTNKRWSNG